MRVSNHKKVIDNSYMTNYTNEHCSVSQVVPLKGKTKRRVYKLVDYNDKM